MTLGGAAVGPPPSMASEAGPAAPAGQDVDDSWSIHCWSGPRCCSTSLMYSFAHRSDTMVMDEPLYASYLRLTGYDRPYRDLVGGVLCLRQGAWH